MQIKDKADTVFAFRLIPDFRERQIMHMDDIKFLEGKKLLYETSPIVEIEWEFQHANARFVDKL